MMRTSGAIRAVNQVSDSSEGDSKRFSGGACQSAA